MERAEGENSYWLALRLVILGFVAGLVYLSYAYFRIHQGSTNQIVSGFDQKIAAQSLPELPKAPDHGLPIRLQIPRIKVDADITSVGLTKAGDMDVPTSVKDVGWYKYGPNPGNKGSAVVAGHLDGENGETGVFINLNKLQKGDILSVLDDQGQAITFVVRETRTYNQNEQPGEVFYSSDGVHLNLVTCFGAWDKSRGSYSKRLVVFANEVK